MSPVFSLSSWLLPPHPSRHQLSKDSQSSSPWIPHQQIHPTMGPKCEREIPDSFKSQNLNLLQASNYLQSISMVLGIISHLEMMKVYRRVCTGDRQIPRHLIRGTWVSSDAGIRGGSCDQSWDTWGWLQPPGVHLFLFHLNPVHLAHINNQTFRFFILSPKILFVPHQIKSKSILADFFIHDFSTLPMR